MKKILKSSIPAVIVGLLVAAVVQAQVASPNYWKQIVHNLVPINASSTVGSSTVNGSFKNLTVAGTCTGCGSGGGVASSGSPLANQVAYWTSNGATIGGSSGVLITNTPTTTAGTAYVSIVPQGNYGSGSHTSSDGAINEDNSLNPNSFGMELYNSNNAATAPLLMVRDNYSTSTQGVAGIEVLSNSTDPYPMIDLHKNGYVPIQFIDTSLNNASGSGEFQLNDRNDAFRFEGRQGDNSQYNVAGLYTRPSAGGQFVWGGQGDILQTFTGAGLFNIVQGQSTTIDYVDISSTSTSNIGNIFSISKDGNARASGTINGSSITQNNIPVVTTVKQFLAPLGNFYPAGGVTSDVPAIGTAYVAKFYLPGILTVNGIGLNVTTAASSSFARLGIYSEDGNTKYIDVNVTTTAIGYQSSTVASVVLQPGTYWEAFSMSTTTLKGAGWTNSDYWGDSPLLHGKATNAAVTSSLPSTLGAILANGNNGLYELLTN